MYTFDPVGIRENTKTNLKFCNQIFFKKKKELINMYIVYNHSSLEKHNSEKSFETTNYHDIHAYDEWISDHTCILSFY